MAALSVDVTEPVEQKPHPFARLEALTARPRPNSLLQPPRRTQQLRQSNISNDQWEVGDEISPVEEIKPMPCKSPTPTTLFTSFQYLEKKYLEQNIFASHVFFTTMGHFWGSLG